MVKLFLYDFVAYFGLCKFLNNLSVLCFVTNLLRHPLAIQCINISLFPRYLKKDKLIHPPPLMEGEAIASRVLELGPAGAKFLGPVIIEVPHFASLRGKEREIVILRSDNGESWREHTLEATEEAVQEVLQDSFDEGGKSIHYTNNPT